MRGLASRRFSLVAALAVTAALAGSLLSSSGVSAQTPTVSVGSLSTGLGSQGTVELEALDIGAPGLGAWTVDIVYDPAVAAVVDCSPAQGGICNRAYAENTVRVVGTSVFGLEGDIALATISFACESVGATDLALSLGVLADATPGAPQPIDAAIANGSVTCTEEAVPTPTEPPAEPPAGPPDGLLGDANCDGTVNAIDAALILQFGALLVDSVPCPQNADVNEDGAVDAIDAALILQYDAGLIDTLPPP